MDTVLSQMDIDDPGAAIGKDTKMGDVAPRAVQEQERQQKSKKGKKDKKDQKDKTSKSVVDDDGAPEAKKRKNVEVNGDVATEGKKKKKRKSTAE